MTDRDLMHKPLPLGAPEDANKSTKLPAGTPLNKLGVQNRAREIAVEADAVLVKTAPEPVRPTRVRRAPTRDAPNASTAAQPDAQRPQAFRDPYFNRDVKQVGSQAPVNQRTAAMKALRGDDGADDLKKIVLPPPDCGQSLPDPQALHAALEHMAPQALEQLDLTTLLARHGARMQRPGVTAEAIQQQMALLHQMVQVRLAALRRMRALAPERLMRSPTLVQALTHEGHPHASVDDLGAAGRQLVQDTASQAMGLHVRLAKVLGRKPPSR